MNNDDKNMEGMNFANEEERETYEFVRKLGLEIEKAKAEIKGDFVVNPEAYTRFAEVLAYCKKFVEENDGVMLEVSSDPRDIHAGIEMEIPAMSLFGKDLKEFLAVADKMDVLGISAFGDEVLISISVNDLWGVVER